MGSPLTAGIVTSAGVDSIGALVAQMGGGVTGNKYMPCGFFFLSNLPCIVIFDNTVLTNVTQC